MPAGNVTVSATFKVIPPTTANYTVKHLQQNLDNDEYTEVTSDRQTLNGTIGVQTTAEAKTYTGFTAQTISQAEIKADGTTVVEIRYNRNTYTVTVSATNGTVSPDKTSAKFGETVTLAVTPGSGYELVTLSVKNGDTEITVTNNQFTMPAGDVTVDATFTEIDEGNQAPTPEVTDDNEEDTPSEVEPEETPAENPTDETDTDDSADEPSSGEEAVTTYRINLETGIIFKRGNTQAPATFFNETRKEKFIAKLNVETVTLEGESTISSLDVLNRVKYYSNSYKNNNGDTVDDFISDEEFESLQDVKKYYIMTYSISDNNLIILEYRYLEESNN